MRWWWFCRRLRWWRPFKFWFWLECILDADGRALHRRWRDLIDREMSDDERRRRPRR